MRQFLRRLFCDHTYQITRWHWFHGFTTMEPNRLEVEHRCSKCGKITYSYPERGSNAEEFVLTLTEKEW